MKWRNGLKYEGVFKFDTRDQVHGKICYRGGERYEGGWVNNLPHGDGEMIIGLSILKSVFNQGIPSS